MAVEVKLDLHGSTQQHGFTDFRLTRATRRGIVTGLTNDNNALRQALSAAAQGNLTHQNLPGLPLASASAVRFGTEKALVRLNYNYSRWSTTSPGGGATALVRTNSSFESIDVYASWTDVNGVFQVSPGGLPNGKIHGIPTNKLTDINAGPPERSKLRVPRVAITIETVLAEDPLSVVGPLLGTVNADIVNIGSITFGTGQLQFTRVVIDWSFQENPVSPGQFTIFFYTRYSFVATKGQHVQQRFGGPGDDIPGIGVVTEWTIWEELKTDSANFQGAFPVNDPGIVMPGGLVG